jgi:predicted RNA binding protein YcfA (HicA-like mRNA interferase family)
MNGFYDQVRKILEAHGCKFDRQGKGSHEIWFSPISNRYFTLSVTCKSRHTANEVLKDAGIKQKI